MGEKVYKHLWRRIFYGKGKPRKEAWLLPPGTEALEFGLDAHILTVQNAPTLTDTYPSCMVELELNGKPVGLGRHSVDLKEGAVELAVKWRPASAWCSADPPYITPRTSLYVWLYKPLEEGQKNNRGDILRPGTETNAHGVFSRARPRERKKKE